MSVHMHTVYEVGVRGYGLRGYRLGVGKQHLHLLGCHKLLLQRSSVWTLHRVASVHRAT